MDKISVMNTAVALPAFFVVFVDLLPWLARSNRAFVPEVYCRARARIVTRFLIPGATFKAKGLRSTEMRS